MDKVMVDEELELLSSEDYVFVGRKSSVFDRYKDRAGMYAGRVAELSEDGKYYGKRVLVDSISPHAIFICGMRGSGKSYTLGVLSEEIALKNDAVGVIIIDPMGIFWSMKQENKVDSEKVVLEEWGLDPTGVDSVKAFIPKGQKKEAPKATWDEIFTMKPSELTVEDWCLTFDMDRFGTMGLLVDKALECVREGYSTKKGKHIERKMKNYSVDDLIYAIENAKSIHSKGKGFKSATRRALTARLKGAKNWGLFDKSGTELNDLSRRGQISVIDISFLENNVRALVVGILARNILNKRKMVSRQEASGGLSTITEGIPITWLLIDEAHILVPGGGRKTAASEALLEYVRQGRQPGCSIVLATQQPSAVDSKILSQTDILFCHKLVYGDDIKAVTRRMPSEIPPMLKNKEFIQNLPIGTVIIGDKQEETSRSFLARIRPRVSQHEGRERRPSLDIDPVVMKENVKNIICEKYSNESKKELKRVIDVVNKDYNLELTLENILQELIEEERIKKKREETETQENPEDLAAKKKSVIEELTEIVEIPEKEKKREIKPKVEPKLKELNYRKASVLYGNLTREDIHKIAKKHRKRRFFKRVEEIFSYHRVYYPIFRVLFDYFPEKGDYVNLSCIIDGVTGEIIKKGRKIERTRGLRDLISLKNDKINFMLYLIKMENATQVEIKNELKLSKRKIKSLLRKTMEEDLVKIVNKGKFEEIRPAGTYDIPWDPRD
ncbi:MAG: DUF87 domain-containing protein, partial [Euryarchaeota archaeon]|nr:DUF87 domain-containing protein [Euryarchaeota archaeon]